MREITLGSLFSASGSHLLIGSGDQFQIKISGEIIPTWFQRHCNAKENSFYLSIFIFKKKHNLAAIKLMIEKLDNVLKVTGKGWGGKSRSHDYHWVNISELEFTRRVFFYTETYVTEYEKEELYNFGKSYNLNIEIYDLNYLEIKKRNPIAFISYDYSVKSKVVNPLAEKLTKAGIVVWYDEYEVKIGDNIHDKIIDGLKKCKYCILIISKEYIDNKRWAKREFENITALETQDGRKRILPVWYNVSKEEVMYLEPRLGNIKGVRADDIEYLTKELFKVLGS
jgi:hypothetical protein